MLRGGETTLRTNLQRYSFTSKLQKSFSKFLFIIAFVPNLVFAAGTGLSKVDNLLTKVSTMLAGGGGLVLTICLMIAGYKVWNGARTMQEMGSLLIGGILISSASLISGLLMD